MPDCNDRRRFLRSRRNSGGYPPAPSARAAGLPGELQDDARSLESICRRRGSLSGKLCCGFCDGRGQPRKRRSGRGAKRLHEYSGPRSCAGGVNFARSPYLLRDFPQVSSYAATFSSASSSELAAAQAILGEISISGKLPVSIPGIAKIGEGLDVPAKRDRASNETQ